MIVVQHPTLWIFILYTPQYIIGKPTPEIEGTNENELLQPADGRSREDWLACQGMPCEDYMKVQAIMAEVNLINYERARLQAQQSQATSGDDGGTDTDAKSRLADTAEQASPDFFGNYLHLASDADDTSAPSWRHEEEEFDILLTPAEAQQMLEEARAGGRRYRRKVISDASSRWEMPIRYTFDGSHNEEDRSIIREAVATWERETCLNFEEHQVIPHGAHIIFTLGDRSSYCSSYVGKKTDGGHLITLAKSCLSKFGTSLHEVGHILGLWHEHQRSNRDSSVTVHVDNIQYWAYGNFEKYKHEEDNDFGVPYDFNSVMHYARTTGSKNGQTVLEPLDRLYELNMGQRVELSYLDIKVINLAYCQDSCHAWQLRQPCENGGYQDPRACTRCRCPPGTGGDYCQTVQQHDRPCGGYIKLSAGQSHTIESPNYPLGYTYGTVCSWVVESATAELSLQFIDAFEIRCDFGTCVHWVEVNNQTEGSRPGYRFCCNARPQDVIVSRTGRLVVDFKSPYPTTYRHKGFKAVITAGSAPYSGNWPTPPAYIPETTKPTTTTTTTTTTTSRPTTTTRATTTTSTTTPRPTTTTTRSTTTDRPTTTTSTTTARPTTTTSTTTARPTTTTTSTTTARPTTTTSTTTARPTTTTSTTTARPTTTTSTTTARPTTTTSTTTARPTTTTSTTSTTTTTTTSTTTQSTQTLTTTTPGPGVGVQEDAGHSDDDNLGDDYYSWTEWGSCEKTSCNCGGCARVYSHRLCGNRKCTGVDAQYQMKECSKRVCTENDLYDIFIGQYYKRTCEECCYGYVRQGDVCVQL